jgi:ferredoxin
MIVDLDRCVGCGTCVRTAPWGDPLKRKRRFAMLQQCGACMRCALKAISTAILLAGRNPVTPVLLSANQEESGACQRYATRAEACPRDTIHHFSEVEGVVGLIRLRRFESL